MSTKSLRPHTAKRINLVIAAAACTILSAAAGMASARADTPEMKFLDELTDLGLVITDTSAAVTFGHAICTALDTNSGTTVADYIFAHTSWADVPDLLTAQTIVVAAADTLCPWQYHHNTQRT